MVAVPRWFGFNPPFIGGQQKVMSRQEDLRLVKNDVLQLILTVPGERVHRPTFGSPLRSSIFEPNDDKTFDAILIGVRDIIIDEEPRLENVVVNGDHDRDNYVINLTVSANLTNNPNVVFLLETELQIQSQKVQAQQTEAGNGITTQNTGPLSGRQ